MVDHTNVRLPTTNVSDAIDSLDLGNWVLSSDIAPLVNGGHVWARAHTLQFVQDPPEESRNSAGLIAAMDQMPAGCAVVIDASNSDCAVWGELVTTAAIQIGVAGVICEGFVRDVGFLGSSKLPIFCRGRRTQRAAGRVDVCTTRNPIMISGVEIHQGDLIVGDDDGVVVVPRSIEEEVITKALEISSFEGAVLEQLEAGLSLPQALTCSAR